MLPQDHLCYPNPATGLTAGQVQTKKENGRQNTQPEKVTKTSGQILKDNICTLFNLFNLLIAIALAFVGAWSNMVFILIIALNTLIGIVQEFHAKKLVDKLSLLSMPTAKVIRDGISTEISIQELVEEDVIELDAGRQVCADSVILTGGVEVNESLLTGESDPIPKSAGSHLLSGSFIISGKCRACVEHIGAENYASKIAHEAKKMRGVQSELLSSMRKVTRFTGYLIPVLGVLLFLEAFFLRQDTLNHAVVTTAAGLLGMLPKGLVLLISISLAVGIIALSKKNVLVQELFALESLAHVDTLCLDKTGTLTQGKMQVEEVIQTELGRSMQFHELMGSFLQYSDDNNATFQALNSYFSKNNSLVPVHKIPFSSERKWSAMTFDQVGTLLIGAPERLADGMAEKILQKGNYDGKRILLAGIVRGTVNQNSPLPPVECLACIVISDPIRPNAAKTLAYFQKEGVDLKLISGDNPVTVSSLALQAGFPEAERYIDMSNITTETEIEQAALTYSVFGRVSPIQKKQLVQALQKHGHSVAMTGDGVNDLLALREADCSIAVAEGSDAARQVSQVVLLDSNFSSLPAVLGEGRRVVNNITRVAGVFFVKTIYSVLLSIVCLLFNIPFPFLPIQITLIDLIIEGYPSFFMSFEPDSKKITGHFLPSVMERAIPNAISILVCFLVSLAMSPFLQLSTEQAGILLYLLVGTVGIQAVLKASWPFNKLRVFLCSTMTVGFYLAVFLFHPLLQVSLPSGITLLLFAGFVLLSFLVERAVSGLIQWRKKKTSHNCSQKIATKQL
ncbi:cation-translocating P-type ATPase [Clostridium facile]|uniref:HAD-IC family P-type ATPase n=1 Tax=Clostridium facile TaxID=2763035 RepID=A0ABR7IQR6_9CLOT|nr:HAD-IC family P-type ATPase [Clostridium facile]MBC5787494.1 HAD-IC family P-type ATPase [Clostridium facile]